MRLTPSAIYGDVVPGVQVDWISEFLKRASQPSTIEEYKTDIKFALESWPASVSALSFKSYGFQVTLEERNWLAKFAGECSPGSGMTEEQAWEKLHEFSKDPMFHQLANKCQEYVEKFDSPPFFKFGTRAPKDSPYFFKYHGRVPNGGACLVNIATSWRAFEDMAMSQVHGTTDVDQDKSLLGMFGGKGQKKESLDHLPWMWFREYQEWQPWQEFRCFMKDRQYMGATQYHGIDKTRSGEYKHIEAYPDLVARGYEYEAALKTFFEEKFLPATEGYSQGCVFDVAVNLDTKECVLIEINAASPGTFPGFMDWADMSTFDGELKWADASYLPDSGVLHLDANTLAAQLERDKARLAGE